LVIKTKTIRNCLKKHDLMLITQRNLEDFPSRVLKKFTPWFPSGADKSLPIKPKKAPESVQPFSRQFHMAIQTFGLHHHQRAKWIICELNCAPNSIEEVWSRLSHAIKHSRLPTCNANLQRSLAQIWVYSDVFYCEYIGHFLRHKLQLSGEINLAVHKLGNIFKL
uniref:Zgc:101664 n=1 Tax=Astyanax mexicanus TaxID=7994 RepID=A0A8B9JVA2_ASTMX